MAVMENKGLSSPEVRPGPHKAPSRLHNFILPPPRWGTVRLLRCRKEPTVDGAESGGAIKEGPSSTSDVDQSISPPKELPENAELPWNLRRRRAFSKGESSKAVLGSQRKEKRKLSVPLSFKEIEADFLLMTGKKPRKRPKKLPRHVQKQVNAIVPGLRLSEVTFDMYKVVE